MMGVTPFVTRAAVSPLAYAPTLMLAPAPAQPPSPAYTVAMSAWSSPPAPSPFATPPPSPAATGAWPALPPAPSPLATPSPVASTATAVTGVWPAATVSLAPLGLVPAHALAHAPAPRASSAARWLVLVALIVIVAGAALIALR